MSEALNTIHAYFGVQNTTTTAPVRQWAYGQKLIIHDPKLPNVFEAYYSNSKSRGDAKPQIGQDGEVRAPHEFFESGADIYVFLMQHEGEEDGRYSKVVHIPITPAPKPVDIDPDPEESLVIGELVDAMNNAVAQCETYVEHYPTVINGEWYVWDESTERFVTTGVAATGNGIAEVRLNQDYTLTLTFTDGTSFTTPISIRGATGATPAISATASTLPEGSSASVSVTGTAENPVINFGIPKGDTGYPTDAQVQSAVDEWYEEHPEGVVPDYSLPISKLVKGTLGFVTPEMFGAVGDGVTDDTDAVNACLQYAVTNNLSVYIPEKTYIVASASIEINLLQNQSLVIYGAGQNSILKRKDDSLTGKWSIFLLITTSRSMTGPAHDVILDNFCIDSNRRGQSMATSGYEYEASADITIRNGANATSLTTQYIDRVICHNMRFYDPVADCFNISGSGQVGVKNLVIDGMIATGRQGTRNDIGITGNPLGDVFIKNCRCGSIHFEYNQTPTDENVITYFISDCIFGMFSLSGKIKLCADNVLCTGGSFILVGVKEAVLTNCVITLPKSNSGNYILKTKCSFEGCTFISQKNDNSNSCTDLYLRENSKFYFRGCKFVYSGELTVDYDNDSINDHVEGSPIHFVTITSLKNTLETIFDNCDFDEVFQYAGYLYCCDKVTYKNMLIKTYRGFYVQALTSGRINAMFDNISLTDKCISFIYANVLNQNSTVTLQGKVDTLDTNFSVYFASATARTNFLNGTYKLSRVVRINTPLTLDKIKSLTKDDSYYLFFDGDRIIYDGNNKLIYPDEWGLVDTGITNISTDGEQALLQKIKSKGGGVGDTANRPDCYLTKGFLYYDTDLNKLIMWSGSAWVNLDGTALA